MLKNIKKRTEGFTIIEVLIVLAIAGLILLIVFLAVPALQRNSRNTQRKNDVAALLGGVTEYANNNGGKLPAALADFKDNVKVGFYDMDADVTYQVAADGVDAVTEAGKVTVVTGAKCGTDGAGTTDGASTRNSIALYAVETSGDPQSTCQEN